MTQYLATTKVTTLPMALAIKQLAIANGIKSDDGHDQPCYLDIPEGHVQFIAIEIRPGRTGMQDFLATSTWTNHANRPPLCYRESHISNVGFIEKITSGEFTTKPFEPPIVVAGEDVEIKPGISITVGCTTINGKTVEQIIERYQRTS
jgi:hypothetical protein